MNLKLIFSLASNPDTWTSATMDTEITLICNTCAFTQRILAKGMTQEVAYNIAAKVDKDYQSSCPRCKKGMLELQPLQPH